VSEDKGLMDGLAGRQDPVSAGGGDWKNEVKVNAPNAVITGIIYILWRIKFLFNIHIYVSLTCF
jgi:hypothetical protein